MFYFGYDNYMAYAFPEDELNPIYCRGRGPDYHNPSNININDVLGERETRAKTDHNMQGLES